MTYFEPGVTPLEEITPSKFAMLDLLLLPIRSAQRLVTGYSDRWACIASHHFPFTTVLDVKLNASRRCHEEKKKTDWGVLLQPVFRESFSNAFLQRLRDASQDDPATRWTHLSESVTEAARETLPTVASKKLRPWISQDTLAIIQGKHEARKSGNYPLELGLGERPGNPSGRIRRFGCSLWRTVATGDRSEH